MAKWIKIAGAAGPKIQSALVKGLIENGAMLGESDGVVTCINHLHDSMEMNNGSMVFYRFGGTLRPFPRASKVCRANKLKCCFGDTSKGQNPANVWKHMPCFLTVTDEEAIARNQKKEPVIRFITNDQLNDRQFWMRRTPEQRESVARAIREGGEEVQRLEKVTALQALMIDRLKGKTLTQLKAMEQHWQSFKA